ncbi:MAG: DUF1266 domain-containing protein [Eubacterium sp.]|nr:DUF1266 domain-containing protein [Eubacterium sp.]
MKKIATFMLTAALAAAALLSGCSQSGGKEVQEETINKYAAQSGLYEISLPGEWTEEDNSGVAGMLALSREDGASMIVLGMEKSQLMGTAGADVESLEDFYNYVDSMLLNGEAATSELSDAEAVELDVFTKSLAKEGTMTQSNGASGKVFVQCAETEAAYYTIVLSATKKYDDIVPTIKEKMGFAELEAAETATLSDTLRWFNATYALITSLNGGDLNLVAGYEPGEMMESMIQEMLERDWEVTDRASLEESITWLLTEGHNKDALDYITEVGADGMSAEELASAMEESGFTEEQKTILQSAIDAKAAYGDKAIAGWDLSRAMSLIGWGYLANFYTYEEAMDKSLETAQTIQTTFGSWDDFINSYFYGYSYWSGENPEDTSSQAAERRQLYDKLKGEGIYDVDWNLQLTKEW